MISFKKFYQILNELSLYDFKNDTGISSLTKKYKKIRSSKLGSESRVAKIKDVKISNNDLLIVFSTVATNSTSKKYIMKIEIDEFKNWYDDLKDEMTLQDLKYVFTNLDAKLDCNCPAFTWQGMKFNLSQLDASIENETKSDDVWGPRHNNNNLLCKHLQGLINNIDFFKNPIISKVNNLLNT